MIPFYIFYSIFGFQRVGDLLWAAGDAGARGFLLGATAGRTTLSGEGLQHEDGHSHVLASTVPNCVSYDPTFGYEVVVIIQDGMRRMYENNENVYYYVTVMNENYTQPEMPKGAEEGIRKGMYLLKQIDASKKSARVQLMGSGTILREVIAAAELLQKDFDIASDIWSATSFTELGRDGMACERWNRMHPEAAPRLPFVAQCLEKRAGPVIAATDYMRAFPDQIRSYISQRFVTLGTDGFGRSDTRANLREFFEVNRHHVVIASLKALADEGFDRQEKSERSNREIRCEYREGCALGGVNKQIASLNRAMPRNLVQWSSPRRRGSSVFGVKTLDSRLRGNDNRVADYR